MKKKVVILLSILLIIALFYLFNYPAKPSLNPTSSNIEPANIDYVQYSRFIADPFRNDKIWILYMGNNIKPPKQVLFDLKNEKIITEASDFWAEKYVEEYQTTLGLLIEDWKFEWREKFQKWLQFRDVHRQDAWQRLILVSHQTNEVTRLGLINHPPNSGQCTNLSPSGRYYQGVSLSGHHFVVDFETKEMHFLERTTMWQCGWFSDQVFFYRDDKQNVHSFNMETMQNEVIVTPRNLENFLHDHELTINESQNFSVHTVWTGKEDRILLVSNKSLFHYDTPALESERWIVELNKETKELELFFTHFPIHKSGRWNESMTKYVYSGNRKTNDRNAVYLLDVNTRQVKILIEPDPTLNISSTPVFYNDKIIFYKGKRSSIWIMDMDGSNHRQIFPSVTNEIH